MGVRGEGRLFKPKGTKNWHYEFWFKGEQYRGTTKVSSYGEAREVLKEAKRRVRGGAGKAVSKLSVEDLRDQVEAYYARESLGSWETASLRFVPVVAFFEKLAITRALDVESHHVAAYIKERLAVAARATIKQELQLLKQGFRLAGLEPPEFPKFTIGDNARRVYVPEKIFRCILEKVPRHFRAILLFRYWCGWRTAETQAIPWTQTDMERGETWLLASQTKNKRPRIFPWGKIPELREAMEAQRAWVSELERKKGAVIPWVFPSHAGKRGSGRMLTDAWATACEACGVKAGKDGGFVTHDFRRTAAKNLTMMGFPHPMVMRIVGWKDRKMYDRYFDGALVEKDIADQFERAFAATALKDNVEPLRRKG